VAAPWAEARRGSPCRRLWAQHAAAFDAFKRPPPPGWSQQGEAPERPTPRRRHVAGPRYPYLAASNLRLTSSQLIKFQNAPMYSGRRFWYLR
jgi:hypothetical protein